jgi:hypothetical protein
MSASSEFMPDMHVTRRRTGYINTRDGVLGFAVIDHQPTGDLDTVGQPSGLNAAKSVRTELALFQGLDPLDHCVTEASVVFIERSFAPAAKHRKSA